VEYEDLPEHSKDEVLDAVARLNIKAGYLRPDSLSDFLGHNIPDSMVPTVIKKIKKFARAQTQTKLEQLLREWWYTIRNFTIAKDGPLQFKLESSGLMVHNGQGYELANQNNLEAPIKVAYLMLALDV
jgi:hypothetical protein